MLLLLFAAEQLIVRSNVRLSMEMKQAHCCHHFDENGSYM
jgi:hypothetical protein